jgi:hypothetical protein
MNPIEHIRRVIDQDIFDYQVLMWALSEYQKPRDLLTRLLRQGKVVRIRKGLYLFGDLYRRRPIPHEVLANLIYGPSVISLDYALSYYGLIPERVYEFTSITTGRSRVFQTPVGRYSYQQVSPPRMAIGAIQIKQETGNWLTCDPLKALADKVSIDRRFRPTSKSNYPDYLFADLRIDEEILEKFYDKQELLNIQEQFGSRKISWLVEYLINKYDG